MKKIRINSILFLILLVAVTAANAQTGAFTFQGKLTDMTINANGPYDFTFKLYDALANGTQIGSGALCNGLVSGSADAVCDDVLVATGVFTVNLDFGAVAFTNGGARFIQIEVRPGASVGAYTTLAPRQEVKSAPFAIKSSNATSANSLSAACALCVTDAHILSIDGSKVTGDVASASFANFALLAQGVNGIVQIQNGGTGSSIKSFVDLTTDQIVGGDKTFTGVLSGNGAGLSNVPGTLIWQSVSGLMQQAQRNTGYLANNAAQVTITLPDSATLGFGDVVRVSGIGAGGWKIAQNAGQSIIGINIGLFGANWTPRESNREWSSVASSTDGSKLVAVAFNGQIYTSTDSGLSWTPRETNRFWQSVASSADGSKLVAVVNGGQIYTSTNSGITWTPRESIRGWWTVASSADGNKLVAGIGFGGQIYTSTDSGVSWTPRESNRNWRSIASSTDGSKLVAVVNFGQIYTSTNSGITWTPRLVGSNWVSVASSADGNKLVAVTSSGHIHTSTDSGVNWPERESIRAWRAVASSADGSKLVAVVDNAQIYTSTDSGVTWIAREINRSWQSVASSANGSKLVAVVQGGGQIYTSVSTNTIGTAGFLTGEQSSAIELQYIGNGQFMPISYVGGISGF